MVGRLRRIGWLAASFLLASDPALAGTCTGLFPDRDCEHVGRHADFIAPIAQPFLFEDAFIVTGIGSFEGADLLNLGARGADQLDLITGAAGLQLRLGRFTISAAYEHPLTAHHGVFGDRVTSGISLEL